jgi:acyl-CoA thioester hydrolase
MSSNVFKVSFRVSWADTDAAQVVHFSNYFKFFEKVEEEFYRHLGFSFNDFIKKGFWLPRVEACCQYEKPARFNDLLEAELAIEELKEKSVKYGFKIYNKDSGVLLATGHVVVVAADKQTNKATRIPAEIMERLKPFCK